MSLEKVIEGWDGRLVSSRFDAATGGYYTIAVHSRQLGPAAGGTRAMVYSSAEDAVRDATRLAGAMTLKMVMAGLPMGGGKSTIALPMPRSHISDIQWRQVLRVHAENIAMLGGNYWTGPDVGTSSKDMDVLHAASGLAFGRSEAVGGPGSSAPETAHGVYVAIRAAMQEAGLADLADRRVVVQGLGAVGYDVARRVASEGARLVVVDIDAERCAQAAKEFGAEVIAPEGVLSVTSDVFVPCATGGVIDEEVAEDIETKVIAGAANNLLTNPLAADVLARRGIVLAPDFVANGGGAVHLVGREVLGWSPGLVSDKVERIGSTLTEIFERARYDKVGTETAARRLAAEWMSGARPSQQAAPDAVFVPPVNWTISPPR